ncbi:MAG: hypothetical protein HXP06_08185 [Trueperella pyogenes]|nr:hypothetical protein [Trueperella pyogenes]
MTFAPSAVQERAVEVISPENPSFTRLIDAVRNSIVDAGLGEALTDPPFGPHFSLAYAVAGTSSEEDRALADALHALKTDNSMECSQIALVEVDQDQEAGIFSFRPLYTWTVGTPR